MAPEIKFPLSARIVAAQRSLARIVDSFWAWLVSFFSKLRAPIKKLKDRISPKQSTDKENNSGQILPPLPPEIPPAPANPENPCKCCHHKTPWWQIVLELFIAIGTFGGFGAACYYAYVTKQMWRESHRNFTIDQRAFIAVGNTFPTALDENSTLRSTIFLRNTGKSAAKNVVVKFIIGGARSDTGIQPQFPPKSTNVMFTQLFPIIYPGVESAQGFEVVRMDLQRHDITLTKDDAVKFQKGEAYLAIYGEGTYLDIFGEQHWFRLCFWRGYKDNSGYNALACSAYNDAGDGTPP